MSPNNLMSHTRKKARRHAFLVPALALFLLVAGCKTRSEDDDTTNTFIRIISLVSEQGTATGVTVGTDLFSDVCDGSVQTGCTVFNDNGVVTFQSFEKDDTNLFSQVNNVIFERYRVTYVRSDGRNVPGVDVPHPFDGAMNANVPIASQATVTFMVVRQQAKLEPPLSQLTGGGGAIVLSTLAQIEFFGRDVSGRPLKVTGFLNISFGDF